MARVELVIDLGSQSHDAGNCVDREEAERLHPGTGAVAEKIFDRIALNPVVFARLQHPHNAAAQQDVARFRRQLAKFVAGDSVFRQFGQVRFDDGAHVS